MKALSHALAALLASTLPFAAFAASGPEILEVKTAHEKVAEFVYPDGVHRAGLLPVDDGSDAPSPYPQVGGPDSIPWRQVAIKGGTSLLCYHPLFRDMGLNLESFFDNYSVAKVPCFSLYAPSDEMFYGPPPVGDSYVVRVAALSGWLSRPSKLKKLAGWTLELELSEEDARKVNVRTRIDAVEIKLHRRDFRSKFTGRNGNDQAYYVKIVSPEQYKQLSMAAAAARAQKRLQAPKNVPVPGGFVFE